MNSGVRKLAGEAFGRGDMETAMGILVTPDVFCGERSGNPGRVHD